MRFMSKKGKPAVSIGTIESSTDQNKIWEEKKKVCKENAIPREKKVSGRELKMRLIDKYNAEEIDFPGNEKLALKINVLLNTYPEAFPESCFPPKEGGEKAMKKWLKQHDFAEIFTLAKNIPDEKYGLQFAYLIIKDKEIKISIELTSGQMQLSSRGYDLDDMSREITLWKGITREDMENETPDFLAYVDAYYHSCNGTIN